VRRSKQYRVSPPVQFFLVCALISVFASRTALCDALKPEDPCHIAAGNRPSPVADLVGKRVEFNVNFPLAVLETDHSRGYPPCGPA